MTDVPEGWMIGGFERDNDRYRLRFLEMIPHAVFSISSANALPPLAMIAIERRLRWGPTGDNPARRRAA